MKKIIIITLIIVAAVGAVVFLCNSNNKVYALDETSCLTCHGNRDISTTQNGKTISLYVDEQAMNASVHGTLNCVTCHTNDPHSIATPLNKQSSAQACGTCHQSEYNAFQQSIHGQQLAQGNQDVPTCTDCHSQDGSPHSVAKTDSYQAPTYQTNISATCGKCHNNQELMRNYGILEKVYQTYIQSIHGKALTLSNKTIAQLNVATCVSCHGSHDVKSVNDPSSPVAGMDNLVKTCQQCHPGANLQFAASFLGHKEASPQNIPAAHYTGIIFNVLLITVVSFGAIVVILAIVRYSLNRWRE